MKVSALRRRALLHSVAHRLDRSTTGKKGSRSMDIGQQQSRHGLVTASTGPGNSVATGMGLGAVPASVPIISSKSIGFNDEKSHEAQLTLFIRKQVIPRLAVAHGLTQAAESEPSRPAKPSIELLTAFADLAVNEEATAVAAFVEDLVAQGVPIESVYLDWIAPAARQMGCDWESDRCDFSQVTIGMWKLQQVLHLLSPSFLKDSVPGKSPRRALLASVPGEQHTLGLFMISEFFRRAGWDVWSELPSDYEDIIGRARGEWFDLVGLSVGGDLKLEALSHAVTSLRRASRNSDVVVMVGGPVVITNPEIALTVGADLAARDARQAVAQAECAVAARVSEQFRR
jgi:MerR family transcriptional regulator, light-induced transcriptional regulator